MKHFPAARTFLTITILLSFIFFIFRQLTNFKPNIHILRSETELDNLLISNNFLIFGLYNSLSCKKCVTYFSKWQRFLDRNQDLRLYNFSVNVVDRANFMNSTQSLNPMISANFLIFYSQNTMHFFQEFTQMTNMFVQSEQHFEEVSKESLKYIMRNMRIMKELFTLQEVLKELETWKQIFVFLGKKDQKFSIFQQTALSNTDIPMFYVFTDEVIWKIMAYFTGLVVFDREYIVFLRDQSEIGVNQPNSMTICPPVRDKEALISWIVLQMTPAYLLEPPIMDFLKVLQRGIPTILYVEGKVEDPDRIKKLEGLFIFLRNHKKTYYVCILPNLSMILRGLEGLRKLVENETDMLYFLENRKKDSLDFLNYEVLEGDITIENIAEQYKNWMVKKSLQPKIASTSTQIKKEGLTSIRDLILGRLTN